MSRLAIARPLLLVLLLVLGAPVTLCAQDPVSPDANGASQAAPAAPALFKGLLPLRIELDSKAGEGRDLSSAVEIVLLLTLLTLLPPLLLTVTCFTRIVIVLSFVRRAMATPEMPPNPVLIGLSLFLTGAVMQPVARDIHAHAIAPYLDGKVSIAVAAMSASSDLKHFLLHHAREQDVRLFMELSDIAPVEGPDDLPLLVVVPAFVLSELRTAFQMGFVLYLPFLVIDLVVSSVLLAMGMYMLPPMLVATPLKILLFVLVDGWGLVLQQIWSGLKA